MEILNSRESSSAIPLPLFSSTQLILEHVGNSERLQEFLLLKKAPAEFVSRRQFVCELCSLVLLGRNDYVRCAAPSIEQQE